MALSGARRRVSPRTLLATVISALAICSLLLWIPAVSTHIGCSLRSGVLVLEGSDGGLGLARTARACFAAQSAWRRPRSASSLAHGAASALRRATAAAALAVADAAGAATTAADAIADAAEDAATAELLRAAAEAGAGDSATNSSDWSVPAATACVYCGECELPDGTWFSTGTPIADADPMSPDGTDEGGSASEEGGAKGASGARGGVARRSGVSDGPAKRLPATLAKLGISSQAVAADPARRNCSRCLGCTTRLMNLDLQSVFEHRRFEMPYTGASPSWTLLASSARGREGRAVAKLLCAPVDRRGRPLRACGPKTLRKARTLSALDALAGACGLRGSLVDPFWMERVRAPLPGNGAVFDGLAFMTEVARGLPGNILSKRLRYERNVTGMIAVMGKVDPAAVIGAGVFDYLVGQCDRHPDNAFLTAAGDLTLIDNDQVLGDAWRTCAHDSMFLPGTEKYDINAFGFQYVIKKNSSAPGKEGPDALVAFDPRCFVSPRTPGAPLDDPSTLDARAAAALNSTVMPHEMPPRLASCVRSLAADDGVAFAAEKLGFTMAQAREIVARARSVAEHGLIGAIEKGPHQNPAILTRRIQPPCCAIKQEGRRTFCAHRWEPLLVNVTDSLWMPGPERVPLERNGERNEITTRPEP